MFELENERTELLKKIEDDLERKQYAHLRDLLLPWRQQILPLCARKWTIRFP